MKKLILLLTIGLFISNMAFSQNHSANSEKETATKITQKMKSDLNLSQDQLQKVEEINLEFIRRINIAKKNTDKEIRQQSYRDVNTYRDTEFKLILSPAQYKKLSKNDKGRTCDKVQ
jgi:hypothetical protein